MSGARGATTSASARGTTHRAAKASVRIRILGIAHSPTADTAGLYARHPGPANSARLIAFRFCWTHFERLMYIDRPPPGRQGTMSQGYITPDRASAVVSSRNKLLTRPLQIYAF